MAFMQLYAVSKKYFCPVLKSRCYTRVALNTMSAFCGDTSPRLFQGAGGFAYFSRGCARSARLPLATFRLPLRGEDAMPRELSRREEL